MRAVFLVLFNREILSYKVKRSFGVSDHGQFQCGISQMLIDDAQWRWENNFGFYFGQSGYGKI